MPIKLSKLMLSPYVVICAGSFSSHAVNRPSLCEYYDIYALILLHYFQFCSMLEIWHSNWTVIVRTFEVLQSTTLDRWNKGGEQKIISLRPATKVTQLHLPLAIHLNPQLRKNMIVSP